MKSPSQDPIRLLLEEINEYNLSSRIKDLSKEDWLRLIHDDPAMQSLIYKTRIPTGWSDMTSEMGSCLADKLADRSFTSDEDFVKIVKNYIYPVLFAPFEKSFIFFIRLREAFQTDLDFTLVCTYILLNNNKEFSFATSPFESAYFEHLKLNSFRAEQSWGNSTITFAFPYLFGPAFEIGLKVCAEVDEDDLLEILKKCPCDSDISMYVVKWALMFDHHQAVIRYLDFLKGMNIDHLNNLLMFEFEPEEDASYTLGMKVKWRKGIPEKDFSTTNSLYMMALLHEADNVIDWIHNLLCSGNTLNFDYFTRTNISLDIMYTPAIAKQHFSDEMHLLKDKLDRYIKAESNGSCLDATTQIRPDNETPLYFYSKKVLQERSNQGYSVDIFIQRFVMSMLFDVDCSFDIFPDQCKAYLLSLDDDTGTGAAIDYTTKKLSGINQVFSHFFKIVDRPFLSLDRYKDLLQLVFQTLSSFHGLLAQSNALECLYPLNWLSESSTDPDPSQAELLRDDTAEMILNHYERAINKCIQMHGSSKPGLLQRAIVWIIKADSFVFTEPGGEVIESIFEVKEGLYKHLSTLITDADLLANIKQSLFDMYMYLASSYPHPLSSAYYEIAYRHLQDIGKYLTIAKYSIRTFDLETQKQQLTESCMQFIQKTSGLSLSDVESYAKPLNLSLDKLKKLLLQEELSYGGFYKLISDIANQKVLQPENAAIAEQPAYSSNESLFSPDSEKPSKKLKTVL